MPTTSSATLVSGGLLRLKEAGGLQGAPPPRHPRHEAASTRPMWLWGLRWGRPALTDPPTPHPGDELIYLDPHTTQPAVATADRCPVPDESFHCQHPPGRMSIAELDPSIAVVRPGVTAVMLLLSEGGPPLP